MVESLKAKKPKSTMCLLLSQLVCLNLKRTYLNEASVSLKFEVEPLFPILWKAFNQNWFLLFSWKH